MDPAEFEKVKDRALRLLARRDHSSQELKVKLKQKLKIENDVFERLLSHLKDLGLMANEGDLSQRWLAEYRREGRGRFWISGKLKTKGLPPIPLSDDDEELEAARHFLDRKLRGKALTQLSFAEKTKLSRSLVSRGFSNTLVASLLK